MNFLDIVKDKITVKQFLVMNTFVYVHVTGFREEEEGREAGRRGERKHVPKRGWTQTVTSKSRKGEHHLENIYSCPSV